jgi:hypothetical protein
VWRFETETQQTDESECYPANAIVASFVFHVLREKGVLRHTGLASTIRKISDELPPHLVGEPRVASLAALCSLLDEPNRRRGGLFKWFKD